MTKMRDIVEIVAEKHGLTMRELTMPVVGRACPPRRISNARREAIWLMRENGPWSWKQIARSVGLLDHATAIRGHRKFAEMLAEARMSA